MKITFLGTGTSHGVPSIDCMINHYSDCPKGVCRLAQDNPRHRRTRSSILVELNDYCILIDVSADLNPGSERAYQKNRCHVDYPFSAGHIGGIPDIRLY